MLVVNLNLPGKAINDVIRRDHSDRNGVLHKLVKVDGGGEHAVGGTLNTVIVRTRPSITRV